MTLRQFEKIVTILERGGLRAAPRHLRITQPGLTRSPAELERGLGAPLFEHGVRAVVTTAIGRLWQCTGYRVGNPGGLADMTTSSGFRAVSARDPAGTLPRPPRSMSRPRPDGGPPGAGSRIGGDVTRTLRREETGNAPWSPIAAGAPALS